MPLQKNMRFYAACVAGLVAFATFVFSAFYLSTRPDYEAVRMSTRDQVALEIPAQSNVSLFVCMPENRADEIPLSLKWKSPLAPHDPTLLELVPFDAWTSSSLVHLSSSQDPASFMTDAFHDASDSSGHIYLLPPRSMDFPTEMAQTYGVAPSQKCASSASLFMRSDSEKTRTTPHSSQNTSSSTSKKSLLLESKPGAVIIAAVSPAAGGKEACILFIAFLGFLWAAFALGYKPGFPRQPRYARFDGILAFFLAMAISFALALLFNKLFARTNHFFPDYGEVFAMLAANFMSFFAAFFAFYLYRVKHPAQIEKNIEIAQNAENTCSSPNSPLPAFDRKSPDDHESSLDVLRNVECIFPVNPSSETSSQRVDLGDNRQKNRIDKISDADEYYSHKDKKHRINYPGVSLLAGMGLVTLAVLVMSFAPLPGLSTAEMASQLMQTAFMMGFAAILAAISEECLFRGVVQASLEAREGAKHRILENAMAVAAATGLFVLVHVPQSMEHLWALIPIGLFAIASGVIKLKSRSIFPSILLHMTYNGLLVLPSVLIAWI